MDYTNIVVALTSGLVGSLIPAFFKFLLATKSLDINNTHFIIAHLQERITKLDKDNEFCREDNIKMLLEIKHLREIVESKAKNAVLKDHASNVLVDDDIEAA